MYLNNPREVPESKLMTEIQIPVAGTGFRYLFFLLVNKPGNVNRSRPGGLARACRLPGAGCDRCPRRYMVN
jgi:hypothetical protein